MSTLYPFQQEALHALKKNHVILVAPTGSGKSRIFHEYLLRNPQCRAILVSPLNALARQHEENLRKVLSDTSRIWIVSPETLNKRQDTVLRQWKPHFLIVDEAHSIGEWGEGFRPDFKSLLTLVQKWNIKRSFWCTATLPADSRKILREHLPANTIELGKFEIPKAMTLTSQKIFFSDRIEAIRQYCLERSSQLGIVFLNTRQMTERLGTYFRLWGIPFWIYHAGMSVEERINLEQSIKKVDRGVILATSAFGMGMDLEKIRYSVLFQPPFTLLALSQALGRATRTSDASEGLVYWHEDDFLRCEWMIRGSAQRRKEFDRVRSWCETHENKRHHLENFFNSSSFAR